MGVIKIQLRSEAEILAMMEYAIAVHTAAESDVDEMTYYSKGMTDILTWLIGIKPDPPGMELAKAKMETFGLTSIDAYAAKLKGQLDKVAEAN